MMKSARIGLVLLVLMMAFPLRGQDAASNTSKTDQDASEKRREQERAAESDLQIKGTPLKVQVVITEFDGNQKISSLPYAVSMLGTYIQNRREAHLRLGVRVPVTNSQGSFSYQDVGTNIDATALQRDDGSFRVDLTVDRSSVIMPMKGTDWKPGEENPSSQPLIHSFRDDFTVVAKPGQTVEGTSAVDPVTGHVLKIEVTVNLAK